MNLRIISFFTIVCSVFLLFPSTSAIALSSVDKDCKAIEVIFARGSGEGEPADQASIEFRNSMTKNLIDKPGFTANQYDLGTDEYGKAQYPHVELKPSTMVGAFLSGGEGFRYGKSVDQGVIELYTYLKKRVAKCTDASFVLAGYSQGAQVIGDTLPQLSQDTRNKIVYIAFFGDPKLNLPEAEKWTAAKSIRKDTKTNTYMTCRPQGAHCIGDQPDACYGVNLSAWRHTIDNCSVTSRGVLGPRTPYVPDDLSGKTNLWCISHDVVCGSNKSVTGDNSGHTSHYAEAHAIPAAAKEAVANATGIGKSKPELVAEIDARKKSLIGSVQYDVAMYRNYACLATPSEQPGDYEMNVKIYADGRLPGNVFMGYGDFFGVPLDNFDYTPQNSTLPFFSFFEPRQQWRPGKQRIYYVLSEPWCVKRDATIRRLLAAQYGKHVSFQSSTVPKFKKAIATTQSDLPIMVVITTPENYEEMVANTRQFDNYYVVSYSEAIVNIDDIPTSQNILLRDIYTPQFTTNEYKTPINQPITVALSPQTTTESVTKYLWDFDGDGMNEQSTSAPNATHTYLAPYDGMVNVTVADNDGATGQARAKLAALNAPETEELLAAPSAVHIHKLTDTSVQVTWSGASPGAGLWTIRVNGFPVGRAAADARSVTIGDLELSQRLTISISSTAADGEESEPASATIEPIAIAESTALSQTGSGVYALISNQTNDQHAANIHSSILSADNSSMPESFGGQEVKASMASKDKPREQTSKTAFVPFSVAFLLLALITSGILGYKLLAKRDKS